MALFRTFDGKRYKYQGSDVRKFVVKEEATKLRRQGKLVRIAKTGKGRNILYTLYVRG